VVENQATESHHHTDHHLKISNKSKVEYTNTLQDLNVGDWKTTNSLDMHGFMAGGLFC
jgi:DNA-nicking Smr family endonuclease